MTPHMFFGNPLYFWKIQRISKKTKTQFSALKKDKERGRVSKIEEEKRRDLKRQGDRGRVKMG